MIPEGVVRAIRRAHPTGRYADVEQCVLDAHLSLDRIRDLIEDLERQVLLRVDIVPPEPDYDRSFVGYVGRRSDPGWLEFNRTLGPHERLEEVRGRLSPLLFWVIQLSRLGPYWWGSWNQFVEVDGRIAAEVAPQPEGPEWRSIIEHVTAVLEDHQFEQIDESVLQAPVAWLDATDIPTLRSLGKGTGPTVYECLFSEVY